MEAWEGETEEKIPEEANVNPCPFCGKKDKLGIGSKKKYDDLYAKNGGACLSLTCHRCWATIYVFDHIEKTKDYDSMKKALFARWNERRTENEYTENYGK